MLSQKARCNTHGQDSSYFKGWEEYDKNPYHELRNSSGIIQMGLAENQLSFDLLESWLADNPDAGWLKKNGFSAFREMAVFQDYHGLPAFKTALAKFMAEIRGNRVQFNPNKLILTAGSTSANENLIFCLAEPGEAFLLPTPYYPGFDRDLKWRTGVNIIPIHCSSTNGFRVTECALEDAYQRAQAQNLRVKGVLITNPSNPLGTTASWEELDAIIAFVAANQIHLISDEIYSGTVFDADPPFISALDALRAKGLQGTPTWRRTHIVYSLSKDLGLPGFRCGAIYSNDGAVVDAATKMSSFGLVSSQTQFLLASMLGDVTFRRRYLEENRKRLKGRRERLVSGLREAGIGCLGSNSGLFCWVDMRHLLEFDTFEAEMDLWRRILGDVGLNISPGSSCHCGEPGWFRVCFANVSEYTLDLAVRRLKAFVGSGKGGDLDFEDVSVGRNKMAGSGMVLNSGSDNRSCDVIMSLT